MKSDLGRPRSFDIDVALDNALHVFWKHGFQGASLRDLTEATGLSKPSLYAAFGDKRVLYLKTLERYLYLLAEHHAGLLDDEPSGRLAVEIFLRSLAEMFCNPKMPGGCFIINGAADFGGSSVPSEVESALRAALKASEKLLRERLERAQREGDLSSHASPADLAMLFCTLIGGLAVQAKSGVTGKKLSVVIDAAMRAWP